MPSCTWLCRSGRFLREARTAAKLSHPNIVSIHAVDEVDDFVFFAMAFVEGESLGKRVRERGPLSPAEAARILREVAWALGHAHIHGVVHRDVTPDNILLEAESGRAMVTDFGIAQVSGSGGLTSATEILGTADFMSPEQASDEAVDARSDLYSLGVVGYYILSGRLPFQGTTVASTLAKHLTQEAPVLAAVAPGVPGNLSQAIDRCLAKDPEERFQSCEELANALTDSLALRRSVPAPLRVFAERNKEAGGGLGAIVLLVVASLLVGWYAGGLPPVSLGVLLFGLVFGPLAVLLRMTRLLLRSGYGYEELVPALESDVAERRRDLEAEHHERSRLNLWSSRILLASGAIFFALVFSIPFVPFSWLALLGPGLLGTVITGAVSGFLAAFTQEAGTRTATPRWRSA